MPRINTTELHLNESARLSNLKLPGSEEIESLEREKTGIGTYLIEILVVIHLIPILYGVFVMLRQSVTPDMDGRWVEDRLLLITRF